ncbi:AAA family ATPase [Chitinophaga japonensis]|uniref:AAA15 family ATPase/GTPase n=1 Tax=Chitinophaga japonensis TaxID=104662 RepID=A0A562T642_CHIJA|nr:ATP-binding protein [Chitinophaga japonensis]TWI88823.1 AAA15 family ATPase/GTPase [Chitinophaga japonensis]
MIHYLKIENFGPIKDEVEINFEVADHIEEDAYVVNMPDGKKLLKLSYIYGANASGKTTVLKAFEFLRKLLLKPIGDKAVELDFEPFLFLDAPYEHPSRFELSFYCENVRYIYQLKFNKQAILNEKVVFYQTAKPTELFTRLTDVEKRLAKIQFGSKIKIPVREKDLLESNTLHNNSVMGAYAKTNVDIPELERLNRWLNIFLLGMVTSSHNLTEVTALLIDKDTSINRWINSFLNKADNQILEVEVSDATTQVSIPLDEAYPPDFSDRFLSSENYSKQTSPRSSTTTTTTTRYYGGPSQRKIDFIHKLNDDKVFSLPLLIESNGTKRYFGLGGPLFELIHHSHLLCIDELESSLHPDLMKYFLQVFLVNSKASQLLITTHNVSLMENQDFIRRDALWFSEKNDDGSISLYSAADFDSSVLRKESSISKAYKSGKLGAKPNLGSPYLTEE